MGLGPFRSRSRRIEIIRHRQAVRVIACGGPEDRIGGDVADPGGEHRHNQRRSTPPPDRRMGRPDFFTKPVDFEVLKAQLSQLAASHTLSYSDERSSQDPRRPWPMVGTL
jgi:hypothetical protein